MKIEFIKDALERVVATYLQAFIGIIIADWSGAFDVPTLRAAAISAIPAALAMLKAAFAQFTNDSNSAAFFPLKRTKV